MQKYIGIIIAILIMTFAIIRLLPASSPVLTVAICADSYWGVPDGHPTAVWEEAIEKFKTQHPNIQVKLITGVQKADYGEWLAEKLLSGQEPDVFLILREDFDNYASKEAVLPLNNLMEADKDFDTTLYYPVSLQAGQLGSTFYALPLESVPTLMFVNKTMLRDYQIPLPSPTWTWQDFYNICQQSTKDTNGDGKLDTFGAYGYTWQQAALDNNVLLFQTDGNNRIAHFEGLDLEAAIHFVRSLQELNQGYRPTARDFDLGHIAFRPLTFAEYRTYQPYPWRVKKYSSFDWDVVPFPAGPAGQNLSHVDTMLMGISRHSKNPQLAWELLKTFSYNREVQQSILTKSQGLPVRADILTDADSQVSFQQSMGANNQNLTLSAIHTIMLQAVTEPVFRQNKEAMEKANSFISHIIEENLPLNNNLNQLQREINSLLLQ